MSSHTRMKALVAAILFALAAMQAGATFAQRPRRPNPLQEVRSPRRVLVGRGSDTASGSRTTITADDSLNDYTAYRSGDRLYIVLPKSYAGSVSRGSGKGYSDVQVQQRGDSIVVSYKVQPGAKPRIEQKFNRLDVVFDVKDGGQQQPAPEAGSANAQPSNEAAARPSPAADAAAVNNQKADAMPSPQAAAHQTPMPSATEKATPLAPEQSKANGGTQVAQAQASPPGVSTPPESSSPQPDTSAGDAVLIRYFYFGVGLVICVMFVVMWRSVRRELHRAAPAKPLKEVRYAPLRARPPEVKKPKVEKPEVEKPSPVPSPAHSPDAGPQPLADGAVLQNRYRVVRHLGRGGMGSVYEAKDTRLGRTVALKMMLAREPHLRRAFEREARILANLSHAALPRVTDHFGEGDEQFLVMDYVPGSDLKALLEQQGRPFAEEEALRWGDELLDALEYLHSHEPPVVHRDIKPSNMKLTARRGIVLLDFGLAKGSVGQTASVTASRSLMGYSPHFAPPEQMQGERTDPRSDLYSLAATLYTLLAGRTPPDALRRVTAQLNDEPDPLTPLRELNPFVSAQTESVIMRALALKPSHRWPGAAQMRAALKGSADAATVSEKTPDQASTLRTLRNSS